MSLKRTPLFAAYQKLSGKLIEFGGWEMPVQYSSITDEHLCVRKAAGIFDISHMGEVTVSGAPIVRKPPRDLSVSDTRCQKLFAFLSAGRSSRVGWSASATVASAAAGSMLSP